MNIARDNFDNFLTLKLVTDCYENRDIHSRQIAIFTDVVTEVRKHTPNEEVIDILDIPPCLDRLDVASSF